MPLVINQKIFMWKGIWNLCYMYIFVDSKVPLEFKKIYRTECLCHHWFRIFIVFYCPGMRFSQAGFCWQPLTITSMFFARLWKGSSRRFTLSAQGNGGLRQLKNPSSMSILLCSRQTYWDVKLKTLNQWRGTLKCPPQIPFILHQVSQWNDPLPQRS